ncbi:MAG: 16S rRNA (uracil(1498)-N(3))-methyltransferase [Chitinophagales bacterium]
MQLFYAPQITQENFVLDEIESRHCIQVLRKNIGDTLQIVDGTGGMYEAIITHAHPKKCAFKIVSTITYPNNPFQIHIAIAPTKNITRFEWFLEKTTEIGITQITPLLTQHSERKNLRTDRLQKILITAMKQSVKAHLPQLNELIPFKKFITNNSSSTDLFKGIAYLDDNNLPLSKVYTKGKSALILIGPEGDFSPEEINFAVQHGFEGVSLGNSRLRTETAGIVACHTLHLANE